MLRQRNDDVENLRAEAQASKSKHSQTVSLSAVLRKRIKILEAEVKSLTCNQKCEEMHSAYADSPLPCPVDPGLCTFAIMWSCMLIRLCILDLTLTIAHVDSLPPLPSNPPQPPDLSPKRCPPPPFQSGVPSPSRESSLAFLSVGRCVGSVDWPLIGSTLQPSGKNVEQDCGVSILVSETPSGRKDLLKFGPVPQATLRLPLQEADHMAPTSSTVRNPLNLTPSQVTISGEFTAEHP